MAAVPYDLEVEQGATYEVAFEWREDDGSDPPTGPLMNTLHYKAFMQIRQKPGGDVFASFDETNGLTVSNGIVSLRIGAQDSAQIVKQGVYDIELHNQQDASDVVRFAEGKVKTKPQITETGDV